MRLCVYSLGVRSARFIWPCLRRTPERDSTLERRSPEVKAEARFRSNCLSFTSWRALGPCLQDCDSLARPCDVRSSCDATQPPRHADSHERFQTLRDSSSRLLRIRGPRLSLRLAAACALSQFGTEGHLAFHDVFSSEEEEGRLEPHLSSCITREHHLASRLDPRGVHIALGQVRSELAVASGSEGFSLFADRRSPDRLLPLGSRLRAEIVGSSPSTSMVAPTWLAVRKIP